MNPISRWFYTRRTKNLFVKIVHLGGQVELHDRPILAADLISRNPKCCVAHPTVFKQPYAIVSPTTTLALGQKYYIVPICTIRKLRLNFPPSADIQPNDQKEKTRIGVGISCWFVRKKKINGQKVKKGKKKKRDIEDGSADGRARLSVASFEYHWQPGLESIAEE